MTRRHNPVTSLLSTAFTAADVSTLRHRVSAVALAAGLTGDDLHDFLIAVNELIINAVQHGGGHGELDLSHDSSTLTCHITDQGKPGSLPEITPAHPDATRGRGLWIADQLAQLHLRHGTDGFTASITVDLPTAPHPGRAGGHPHG
ncbi:ATP-binding protein [Micromonospora fluostatini]|uniref:ATP-binding protein n=1 Tax=Micromonospora sp. JCM 30529 TaxID=3421643 RepID=UPI003D167D54